MLQVGSDTRKGRWYVHVAISHMLMLQIMDEGTGDVIEVSKVGFPDAVVWNPWIDKSKAMADFGDAEYKVGC